MGVAPPIHGKFISSYIYSTIKARNLNVCTSSLVVNLRSRTKNGRDPVRGRGTSHTKKYLENYESDSLETWCELMNDVCEKFCQKWV